MSWPTVVLVLGIVYAVLILIIVAGGKNVVQQRPESSRRSSTRDTQRLPGDETS